MKQTSETGTFSEKPGQPGNRPGRRGVARPWIWVTLLAVAALGAVLWLRQGSMSQKEVATFKVRKGPLDITVLEGGSVRAVESQEVKCEVRVGYQGLKILKIVEEGYEVTAEDIRTNKVLVELDSSDLQKQIVQQDIQYETAVANLTDAQQNYEIQLNQNLSDIKAAEQKVRFARMDFDKYLGDTVTQAVIEQLGLDVVVAKSGTNGLAPAEQVAPENPAAPATAGGNAQAEKPRPGNGEESTATPVTVLVASLETPSVAPNSVSAPPPPSPEAQRPPKAPAASPGPAPIEPADVPEPVPSLAFDFSKYAAIEMLGDGEAKQKLRKFEDDLQVARKEEGQTKATLEGTKRLFEKGFVTRIDLERDEIAAENARLKVQTATTARDLFLKYEFFKSSEEALSKYAEAVRELTRARKAAISRLAQARAKLKSCQGQHNIQSRQRKELNEQLEKCRIRATKPGLVVYGRGGDEMFFYGGEERVREGATVREQQPIITIPDMSKMSVRVRIHESYIKKIKKGQKAKVRVDAFPDKELEGEVTNVGVLPDSQNMWLNPDMKVYLTTITLSGTNEWLKPGMSAKVEIMVTRLDDVIYVPVQAVSAHAGKQVCYVAGSGAPDRREVEVGEFNDEFIEIKRGLKEGESVLLRPAEKTAPEPGKPEPPKTPPVSPKGEAAPVAPA